MYTLLLIGVLRPLLLEVGGVEVEAEVDLEMEEEGVVVAIIMMYMLVLTHSPALVLP